MRSITFDPSTVDQELRQRYGHQYGFETEGVRNELAAFFAILSDSLATLSFTESEASLIIDALNGTLTTHVDYRFFWMGVEDAVQLDGVDAKWGVDSEDLLPRLRNLSPGHCLAVVDAANRYWADEYEHLPHAERLRRVGLVR